MKEDIKLIVFLALALTQFFVSAFDKCIKIYLIVTM